MPPDVQAFAAACRKAGHPDTSAKPCMATLPAAFGGFSQKMYVRASWIKLQEWLDQQMSEDPNFRGMVVSGNPGIGKSYFLAWQLAR